MTLEQIKILIQERRYDEALEACEKENTGNSELNYEIHRQKSHIYSRQAKYQNATSELEAIIKAGVATLGDYDSAAFWALYDGQIKKALEWYLIALDLGEEQNESWFRSNELCLIAYIYMELGEFEKALEFLDESEKESDGSFLIPNKGFCERNQLRDEIRLRSSKIS